jgi:hypothetical protein
MKRFNRKAFRRSVWSSLSRLIGVGLGAGAGDIIHRLVGGGINGWSIALGMAGASFFLMLFAEYERESGED